MFQKRQPTGSLFLKIRDCFSSARILCLGSLALLSIIIFDYGLPSLHSWLERKNKESTKR